MDVWPQTRDELEWYPTSPADPAAIDTKRSNPRPESRPAPSAMLLGIDTAARFSWIAGPYR
jgi:hypothetical protein